VKSISCEKEQTDSLAGHLCGDQLLECVKVFNIRMSSVIESAFGKLFSLLQMSMFFDLKFLC